ncbi:MAG TPA: D-alanine--D-alanine ligase [Hyphomicrobiaceae bacterium]|nr:D-alanine--D-alanine ligase [Hyphomicrobiaceae bacterium]
MSAATSARKFHHIAVLMGGLSAERQVSLDSGNACAEALESAGYKVTRIDAGRDLAERLRQVKPEACFNALHGRWGEDGCVQGLLELIGLPYTHSGVLASALAMHKERAKAVMRAAGIPTPDGRVVRRSEAAKAHVLPRPYVLKPVAEGSSVGVYIVPEDHEHPPQELNDPGWAFGEELLAERYIPGRELTCAVMGDTVLGVTEIVPAESLRFYNYEAKYAQGGSRHILPAPLQSNIYELVQKLTLMAHRALGCRGVSRADFRYDDTAGGSGEVVCLEVNTQPGMTATSLVPELAAHAGLTFAELVSWMVEEASCNR